MSHADHPTDLSPKTSVHEACPQRGCRVCLVDVRGRQDQDHPGLQCEAVAQKQQYTVKGSGAAGLCAEETARGSLGFLFIEQADRRRLTSFLRNLTR